MVDRSVVYRQDQGMRITHPATLSALIELRGLRNASLARKVGCGRSFIGHLVAGRKTGVSPELARRIEEALDVPEGVLFLPTASAGGSGNGSNQQHAA
jgi:hypothetical protein